MLNWASTATEEIIREKEQTLSHMHFNVPSISGTIYDSLLSLVTGGILSRLALDVPEGRGLEMWRMIYAEWVSKSPHVMETYRNGFLHPSRCKNMEDVRTRLPVWLRFGRLYEKWYGHALTDESKIQALKLLVPAELSDKLEGYTFMEHKSFNECLRWVQN